MATRNNTALTGLELRWVNDRKSVFGFGNYCPLFISARQAFTNLAGVLSRQLNHMELLSREWQALLAEKGQFVEISSLKDDVIINNFKEAATA